MRFVIMAAVFVMKDSEETALSAMVSKHTLWEEENRFKKEKKNIARVRYDESMQSLSNENCLLSVAIRNGSVRIH